MPSAFTISIAAANAALEAIYRTLLSGGTLEIYTGPQPASADVAVTSQLKLAQVVFATPACGPASGSTIATSPMAPVTALATGQAAWFRCRSSAGAVVCDGSVGTAGADLNLSSTLIQAGALVTITSLTFTELRG